MPLSKIWAMQNFQFQILKPENENCDWLKTRFETTVKDTLKMKLQIHLFDFLIYVVD